MPNPFQRLRDLLWKPNANENGYYLGEENGYTPSYEPRDEQRQLYTALDIGTAYAKAMIVEVQDDIGVVLGVGRHQQSYSHMSDGIVTDIPGVIANCNEALLQAEQDSGGLIAPNTVIGIAGELVKGSSITITKQRTHPAKPITPEELESVISNAQQKLLKTA
jgi:cell division protein FtsA